ncbi:Rrf2 family transcriptional regulator [Muricoccus vinaceus]|uniref:Rrf2 family transcriptional regulator n=1 Tax=Muricoccus vinaceus TaxID=424704 RepID=A0ABV6IL87_9PROT
MNRSAWLPPASVQPPRARRGGGAEMRLSTRGRYAVMALTEMARRGLGQTQGAPVALAEIAQAQMLSVAYMEQLFARLRRAGLVRSARGPGGGYRLSRPAGAITVAEIVEAVDDTIAGGAEAAETPDMPPDQRDLWRELGEQVRFFLSAITLQDVVDGRTLGRAVPVPGADDPSRASPSGKQGG